MSEKLMADVQDFIVQLSELAGDDFVPEFADRLIVRERTGIRANYTID
jgi:hypothetical protein